MTTQKRIVIRHELVSAAVASIWELYAELISGIQAVKDGDGNELKAINWGAFTPAFLPVAYGSIPQWTHQEIILELRASVDYLNRSLDSSYRKLLEVFEDFCARPDLEVRLSNEYIKVVSPPTFEEGAENIENGRYITTYRLRVSARERLQGDDA